MVAASCHVRERDSITAMNNVHKAPGPRHKYSIIKIGGKRGELSIVIAAEKINELKAAVDEAAAYLNTGDGDEDTIEEFLL